MNKYFIHTIIEVYLVAQLLSSRNIKLFKVTKYPLGMKSLTYVGLALILYSCSPKEEEISPHHMINQPLGSTIPLELRKTVTIACNSKYTADMMQRLNEVNILQRSYLEHKLIIERDTLKGISITPLRYMDRINCNGMSYILTGEKDLLLNFRNYLDCQ
jgi:hypothetical protein